MVSTLPEVEEQATQERGLAGGPSNPMAQHAYDGFAKTPSRSGLVLGAIALALVVLVLASVFGLWLVRSVRRLNRQVTQLSRQTEQLNRRLQGTEQQTKALAQQASQVGAQAAAPQHDQAKESETTSPAQAQPAHQPEAAAQQGANRGANQAQKEKSGNQREAELQRLEQSFGQIAETRHTAHGLVMTLGEKSIRFDADKSDIAPQYRAILKRIASVLMPLKGYSIYVYGYTDDSGTKDYNLKLSVRRARSVRDSLVQAGIGSSLISTKGFGKSDPHVRGNSPKARAANRRVEIGIVDSTPQSGDEGKLKKRPAPR
jgi:outer membrane protein OmpA-like peptidoglycan-associated protein